MSNVALITGTSSGVGLELAVLLARRGFTTIATMRDPQRQTALQEKASEHDVSVDVRQLDVQDPQSIQNCVEGIIKDHGRIDLLVNNAGAGFIRTTEQASEEEIEWVLDVNTMGVIRCTKAVLPHMRGRRRGHIINVTSVGGLVGQPFNEMYCAAKFAVEGYTEAMASYVQPSFNIHFTAVEPGGIATEFVNSVMSHLQKTGGIADDEYKPILDRYLGGIRRRSAAGDTASFQTGEEVAAVIADCAESDNPPLRLRTSKWAEELCAFKTSADPDGTRQQAMVIERFLGD